MIPRFGTDGLRGVANAELTAELLLAAGRAAARTLRAEVFVAGADTRLSSPMLKAAFAAGIAAEGGRVDDVGIIPTPGVAFLAAARGVPGAVISASHNPFSDNGLKLISQKGTKLAEPVEAAVEAELERLVGKDRSGPVPSGAAVGNICFDESGVNAYVERLASLSGPIDRRIRVVCDCANGAAGAVAPLVFERLGIDCDVIGADPNGTNINDGCGATHPEALAAGVLASRADVGLAFDGDADRLIAVADDGSIVDGDVLLALFALDLHRRGELERDGVVVTVMANLGLRRILNENGLFLVETSVGDRYVAEALEANGLVLGGEQSGHIMFSRLQTTGDGILTGLKLLELLSRAQKPLSELATAAMTRCPQELRNVVVERPERLADATAVWTEVKEVTERLGDSGRVLLRASGTEAAIRIMVEADDERSALEAVDRLVAVVHRELRD